MNKQVWLIVWGIFSVAGAALILAFFLLPENVLHAISRTISVPHDDCAFCGMTRAFCSISKGEFEEAYRLNRGSIVVFSAVVIASLAFFSFFTVASFKKGFKSICFFD